MHFRKLFWYTPLLLALALSSCRPASRNVVDIGVRTANDHAPFFIADSLDLYAEENIATRLHLILSNTTLIEAIQRGDIQIGVAPITTVIAAIESGIKVKIVAMTGRGSDGILVRADSGIRTMSDLRGKRIATIDGSILDVLLRLAISQAGLDSERDVEIVFFSQLGDMVQALKTGQVDACSNTEPLMTKAEREGWGEVMLYYTAIWPDHPCCVVFARQDFIDQSPSQLRAVLRAHLRAIALANANPDQTAEIISAYLGDFDLELIRASLAPDKMRIDADISPEEVEHMAAVMLHFGIIEHQPSVDALMDLRFLQAIAR